MRLFILLLFLIEGYYSYKFLVYNPLYGHSHTTFLSRIADTLAEAGHDVTVLFPVMDESLENKTAIKSNAKQILLRQTPEVQELIDKAKDVNKDRWTAAPSITVILKMAANFSYLSGLTCEAVVSNTDLITQLQAEKFDVGIAEPVSICGLGLFDHLQIPTIGALSLVQADIVSLHMGEPWAPSYVPSMSSADGEKMGFFARMKNGLGTVMGSLIFKYSFAYEAEALTKYFGKDYVSDYSDLIGGTSFMFTNANPYLNYPRPLLHKTIEIGGITVDIKKAGDLGKWEKVLNERKHTVFISFGSMAKSIDMPAKWKESLLSLFASLPDVTFIWKYEELSTMADHLPNVHLGSWLPQNALLADPRLSLFITHGGLGSTTEVAHFGKPSIMIPLFGDQPRNAAMLARQGGAIALEKNDLGNVKKLRGAITRVLNDPSFAANATKLAKMLQDQPISAKDLVISHAEFVAKYGPLKQINPYGRKLSTVQYYLLDVMAFVLVASVVVLFVLFIAVRCVFRRICRLLIGKSKVDKNQLFEYRQKKLQ